MGCEDNIARTTLYISKTNYNRVKEERKKNPSFNLSKFVEEQLTTYFFGDKYEHKVQMMQIAKRLDEINKEQQTLLSRKTELQKKINSFDIEQKREQELYQRFLSNINARIKNMTELNLAPDYDQICKHFQRSFFPNNNFSIKHVKEVFHLAKNEKLSFDVFQEMRRGNYSGY